LAISELKLSIKLAIILKQRHKHSN